jgi:hypothetical protein
MINPGFLTLLQSSNKKKDQAAKFIHNTADKRLWCWLHWSVIGT